MQYKSLFCVIPAGLIATSACSSAPPADIGSSSDDDEALTNAQISKIYTCASDALWTVAGLADTLICGTTAVPSGGLTLACYVIGAGATGAGALAYCGGECAGAHTICPGYGDGLPEGFTPKHKYRLLSRCIGDARYSHWEGSKREFLDGKCICRRSCPTRE
jgi:hypothetical protein